MCVKNGYLLLIRNFIQNQLTKRDCDSGRDKSIKIHLDSAKYPLLSLSMAITITQSIKHVFQKHSPIIISDKKLSRLGTFELIK